MRRDRSRRHRQRDDRRVGHGRARPEVHVGRVGDRRRRGVRGEVPAGGRVGRGDRDRDRHVLRPAPRSDPRSRRASSRPPPAAARRPDGCRPTGTARPARSSNRAAPTGPASHRRARATRSRRRAMRRAERRTDGSSRPEPIPSGRGCQSFGMRQIDNEKTTKLTDRYPRRRSPMPEAGEWFTTSRSCHRRHLPRHRRR